MIASIGSIHDDLPRPRRLAALNRDLKDTIAVRGVDAIRVDVIRKRDDAPELAVETLAPVVLGFFGYIDLPASRNGQQVLLDRKVEALRVKARREQIDVDPFRRGADVDGRKRAPANRADPRRPRPCGEELIHFVLDAPEAVEEAGVETTEQTTEHSAPPFLAWLPAQKIGAAKK